MSDQQEELEESSPPRDRHGYVIDEQIGYLLRKAYQRNAAIYGEKVQCGVTPAQFALVARLAEVGSISQNQLGRTVGLDVATTKGVVDRLRARGLIETQPDPNDRRRQLVSLSPEGRALYEENAAHALEVSAETLAPLSVAERRTFLKLLKKLQ